MHEFHILYSNTLTLFKAVTYIPNFLVLRHSRFLQYANTYSHITKSSFTKVKKIFLHY